MKAWPAQQMEERNKRDAIKGNNRRKREEREAVIHGQGDKRR